MDIVYLPILELSFPVCASGWCAVDIDDIICDDFEYNLRYPVKRYALEF